MQAAMIKGQDIFEADERLFLFLGARVDAATCSRQTARRILKIHSY